jgi:hypothetical protein
MRQKKIMSFAMSFCIRSGVFLIDDKCVYICVLILIQIEKYTTKKKVCLKLEYENF